MPIKIPTDLPARAILEQERLTAFYQTLDDVKDRRFDALIVTGAPYDLAKIEAVS